MVLISLLSLVGSWWLKEHLVESSGSVVRGVLVGHGKDEGGRRHDPGLPTLLPGSASHLGLRKFAGSLPLTHLLCLLSECVNQMTFESIASPQINIISQVFLFPRILYWPSESVYDAYWTC